MYGVFGYEVGNLVRLGPGAPVRTVTARAWVLLPVPGGGWHRAAVYRLNDGYWDGYFEAWLLPAFAERGAYNKVGPWG